MVAYFSAVMILIYIDRGAFSSVIIRLKKSGLGINDVEAGILSSVFVLGFMVASPLYAWLA
jgi:hypothetical protein